MLPSASDPSAAAPGYELTGYEAGPRARGSLTAWFSAEAIEGWRADRWPLEAGSPAT
jgi:hypothetical protein